MIVILDTETTGLDPNKDRLIEVGMAKFDEENGCLIECCSFVVESPGNDAQRVNGIPPAILTLGRAMHLAQAVETVRRWADGTRAIVAHNAEFDKKWLPALGGPPWVCSLRDIDWPNGTGSLEKLALAHGIGVLPGHRAIYDVLTLVRVFATVGGGTSLIDRALRPRVLVQSNQSFGMNRIAQDAGFAWHAESKRWLRRMAKDDYAAQSPSWGFRSTVLEDVR